ncbi:MAG: YcxB family protein [Lachnospiraceae bacterium]|nr:YcxB family protein [Lachnospiraceae bacterium]
MNIEVKMTTEILYNYLLRHTYKSISGWLNIFFALILLVAYFFDGNILIVIGGAFILIHMPLSLFSKAKKQMLLNKAFKNPLKYHADEEGVKAYQNEETVLISWEHFLKAVMTKKSIILYTSPVKALIFPFKDLGANQEKLKELIRTYMPPAKVKM